MRLTSDQIDAYDEQGYLLLPGAFSPEEIGQLGAALADAIATGPRETQLKDRDGGTRLVYGLHHSSPAYALAVRLRRVLEPARQLLGGDVYVHQTKVTLNTDHGDGGWAWHQDYAFWQRRDHVPGPGILSAALYLDDVTYVNGPLFIVPRSHKTGLFKTPDGTLDRERTAEVCASNGIDIPIGPAGSVLFFHGQAVHGSPGNISPFDRRILYITYNAVVNAPDLSGDMPPVHLAGIDFAALTEAEDSALLTSMA
jgi:ectoine hydroxylase